MSGRAGRARDPLQRLIELLPGFAARAAVHDDDDTFVAQNYEELKTARLMGLAVPRELGGEGLDLRSLADVLRGMASACASTALVFSMHNQAVASLAWHWRHQKAPVSSVLRRIARDQLAVATTNGSDWLNGSGVATRTKVGYRIRATKRIVSSAPSSDLLATSAVYDDAMAGPTILHFIVAMDTPRISIDDSWRAMGMRGTGSHHIQIDGLVVSDRAIVIRRPRGKWHPLYHGAVMVAMPLIFSVYLGIAEAARDAAIAAAKTRQLASSAIEQIGAIEGHLNSARLAVEDMLAAATTEPDKHSTKRILMDRTLAGTAAIAAVEAALEIVGGAAYIRPHPLERMFRDVQAARFHPIGPAQQRMLAGRVALGLDIDESISEQTSSS
jgi:acyl-CoA dehydrogenase